MTDWQGLRDREFAFPEGESVGQLVDELVEMLASPDPAIRDQTAYSAMATWIDAFERWYAAEQDLRGHDAELGWLHAVAHGADLLGTVGQRKEVSPDRMLALASARMLAPTDAVWHDQEPDRLAYAIGKVLTRADLSERDAVAWLDPVARLLSGGEPGPVPAQVTNTLHTLRTLYLLVDRGVRVSPAEVVQVQHRVQILDGVADTLQPATSWMY